MAEKPDPSTMKVPKDVVSQDRNWVYRINNQIGSQKIWDKQWGYLSGGFSQDKCRPKDSLDSKIQQLQQQIRTLDSKDKFSRSSQSYGKGTNVELYMDDRYKIRQSKDLRALERRLPKNWKKQKWTAPVDPYDPIANMYKKKK